MATIGECNYCGGEFKIYPSTIKKGGGKYCSKKCQSLDKSNDWDDLWGYVDAGRPLACWEWNGSFWKNGYGRFKYRKEYRGDPIEWKAHRAVWKDIHGEIPEGMVVRHECDNKSCCNPLHLQIGTMADNVKDMDDRNRRRPVKGEEHGMSKLSREGVIEIKERLKDGETHKSISSDFNCGRVTITEISNGKRWKHIKV